MTNRKLLAGYLAWMAILAVADFLLPTQHVYIWTTIGASSVTAMLVGIRRNRPRRRGPWLLLAAAVACLVLGDLTADLLIRVFHQPDPFPSVADVLYLTMYLLLAGGMVWLYRLGVVGREVAGVLDALTLTAGVALLSWVYLIGPYVKNPDLTGLEKAISIAYPLGDILGLAAGAALVASIRPTPAVRLLALGGLGLLTADVAYGVIQLHGTWEVGTPVDLGWITFYLCWGAAALHPSMRDLTEPKIMTRGEDRLRRLVLIGLSCLIAPTVLLVEVMVGEVHDGLMIAILSAVLSLLVLTRLARALRQQRRSLERERALRRAGARLLLATDATAVSTVVRETVANLLPPGRDCRVALDLARNPAGDTGPATAGTASAAAAERNAMVYRDTLSGDIARRLGGFEVVLQCPLPAERGHTGTLYIGAAETSLVALQDSAQVLAAQAGLTLQRILLGAEVDRRNSEAYFRTLVLNTADVILIVDVADRIRYASPSANALFEAHDLVGAALPHLVEDVSRTEVQRRLGRVRERRPDERGEEWHIRRPSAGEALVEATCRDLRGEPTVDGLVVTLRDVTESRRMQDELFRRATYDALTGLPNREVFLTAAGEAIGAAAASGRLAGAVVIELDDFKRVNNTMGHQAGDELLVLVGRRLAEALRDDPAVRALDRATWPVTRMGGDEFATCLVDVSSQTEVDRAVRTVMDCFTEPFVVHDTAVTLGASVGVAMTTGETDAQELLRQADLAVSVAKEAGKGRSLQYEAALHTTVVERLRLRNDLAEAIAAGDFVLEYQPIVALALGRTSGFEALVRWDHPTRGRLSPAEFIELAEESGLIVPLGSWVLHHAIEAAASWPVRVDGERPYVSVNVSARQLRTPDFVDRVRAELAGSRLPPDRLILEITESLLVGAGGVGQELAELRADGVRVAIDDFGTGFSSLSYLRELPVDVLKLDKSFVDTVTTSREQYAIINAVTQIARTLRLDVVAEGIETGDELAVLTAMGCGFGQGYLLSRPMSYSASLQWLRNEASVSSA